MIRHIVKLGHYQEFMTAMTATLDGDVDQGYFEALLATMKLDPASALDPPNPS